MPLNTEKVLVSLMVVVVFFLLGGGSILFTGRVESSLAAKVIWAIIYAVVAALAFSYSRSVMRSVQCSAGYLSLALLCLVSILWTSDRATTLSYSIAFFGSTLMAYLLASKIEPMQLLRLATVAIAVIMLVNFTLMLPGIGVNLSPGNRYAGIFPQPNVLGRVTGLGVLLCTLLYFSGQASRWALMGVGIGLCLIFACNSMTTMVSVLASSGLFFLRKLIGRPIGSGHILIGLWFSFCLGGLVWLSYESLIDIIFGLIGRSSSLTGRTDLWDGILGVIFEKPLLGYGYSGFWAGEPLLSGAILKSVGWTTESAHNGLFDIALHLGLIGVAIFVASVMRMLSQGVKLAYGTDQPLAIILLCLVCYLLLIGISESTYMMRNSIYWVTLVICAVYTQKLKRGDYKACVIRN